jgi:hypothetical protein
MSASSSSGTQPGRGGLIALATATPAAMHAATNSNAQPLIVKRAEVGDSHPALSREERNR